MKLNKLFKAIWKYRHIWGPIVIEIIKPIVRKIIEPTVERIKKYRKTGES